ncbi:chemotaxis response regulator protein-glutamate methylesterase [Siminovitchia terrae]|uniref:Protein-glutamate methylesterase/protein-glutamine glutaminase n=1 Tax=Siminovitchia terrae TaxID=1914933 RepID=A0A429X5K3_SIMTE|nr:chemotaxis response regulator protein-glutamate methylesterase [Siminovitchia terrae]RST58718.1 chemotaxis response regulator protein-glutamate methylesterase [Siminovitchia terrae]GIN90006.1 chemotaxis response regulator protein-glutamate methylesterase [Siminovitchia terrae]GIN94474.1 chemotaxis response regulator protein-glutamate methylesterase [Siminovitchia terrae]
MGKIKVLIVDDSIFMRKLISDFVSKDDRLEVAGTAKNGLEAIELTEKLKPDVITMDVEMPEMDGLTALKHIMQRFPTPVLMVSSLTEKGAYETIKALQLGAVDFIQKPSGSVSLDLFRVREELILKIKAVAKARLAKIEAPVRRESVQLKTKPVIQKIEKPQRVMTGFKQLFAVGTSTGGPKALETVITGLPAGFKDPLLVVQHMPPKFTEYLAKRLDSISNMNVVEAQNNQVISGGTVYIAPGDYHMGVRQRGNEYRIVLNKEAHCNGHRPSVDVLYDSVSKLTGLKRHYIIMTGMGGDGAAGMKRAKDSGAAVTTVAESEETCIVYGMPKTAVNLGCVDHILPLTRISAKMIELSK